jgi:cytochrome b6-f complex iron-sulfur subunit
MAEKKKLSTAEILAAARKGTAAPAAAPSEAPPPAAEAPEEAPAAEAPAAAASPPAAKPKAAPAAGGARPSVADILAAARAGKAGAAAAPAAKPAPKAEAPAAKPKEKPAPKAEPKAKEAAPVAGGPKDTASILAAARKGAKPGPVTKAEAAAHAAPPAAKAESPKGRAVVPPMPARPEYAKPAAKPAAKAAVDEDRRGVLATLVGAGSFMLGTALGMGFTTLGATLGLWTLGTARFMFPNVLTEPPSQFKVGFPADFPFGSVSEKFKAQFGVWIVNWEYNGQKQIYALRSVCTHLGCTPNWLEGEQKFKCPCHGSGFYKDGINFEGPAPRPLERYAISEAPDGQLLVDKSRLFQQEMGQWEDPTSFVPA